MKCAQCGGKLTHQRTSYTIARSGYHLTVNDIPAWVCTQCGQPLFDDEQSATLERLIAALDAGAERLRTVWRV